MTNSWLSFWLGLDSNAFAFLAESCAMFTEPTSTENINLTLKLGPTTLFTYFKIILLQCFQFSVFSNKQYLNRSFVCREIDKVIKRFESDMLGALHHGEIQKF